MRCCVLGIRNNHPVGIRKHLATGHPVVGGPTPAGWLPPPGDVVIQIAPRDDATTPPPVTQSGLLGNQEKRTGELPNEDEGLTTDLTSPRQGYSASLNIILLVHDYHQPPGGVGEVVVLLLL